MANLASLFTFKSSIIKEIEDEIPWGSGSWKVVETTIKDATAAIVRGPVATGIIVVVKDDRFGIVYNVFKKRTLLEVETASGAGNGKLSPDEALFDVGEAIESVLPPVQKPNKNKRPKTRQ
jgi:hypothetical protein